MLIVFYNYIKVFFTPLNVTPFVFSSNLYIFYLQFIAACRTYEYVYECYVYLVIASSGRIRYACQRRPSVSSYITIIIVICIALYYIIHVQKNKTRYDSTNHYYYALSLYTCYIRSHEQWPTAACMEHTVHHTAVAYTICTMDQKVSAGQCVAQSLISRTRAINSRDRNPPRLFLHALAEYTSLLLILLLLSLYHLVLL